eukprot:TRINITY_DN78347_c0_g1_i1.p1 TRINITY_DN78347_c0_g1~~TRINITY_DN78347_c0_g1_i1.p1  ORF type:complete len:289 (+),score=15.51 TRINITY_DN78347_c0_g1_i1:182-1048(+)
MSRKMDDFKEADLSKLCWSLARLRHFEPSILEHVFSKIKSSKECRQEFDLPVLLYGFAVFDSPQFDQIFEILKGQVQNQISQFNCQALLSIYWSYGIVQKGDSQFWEFLVTAINKYVPGINTSRISLESINDIIQINFTDQIGKVIKKRFSQDLLRKARMAFSVEPHKEFSVEPYRELSEQVQNVLTKLQFKGVTLSKISKQDNFEGDVVGLFGKSKVAIFLLDQCHVQNNNDQKTLRIANRKQSVLQNKGYKVITLSVQEWLEKPKDQQKQYIIQCLKLGIPSLRVG